MKSKIDNILKEAISKIGYNLRNATDSRGYVVHTTGKTERSMEAFYKETSRGFQFGILSNGSGAPFSTTQHGRAGGKVPAGFHGIIQQWVIDKGIQYSPLPYKRKPSTKWQPKYTPEQRGLLALSGAIAHKIKERGTLRHSEPRDDIYTPVQNWVVEQVGNLYSDYIINELLK